MPPEDAEPGEGGADALRRGPRDGPDLLLTERAHHMRSHPGQVSFPGGSIDPGETAVEAALREAEEETGLDPAGVDGLRRAARALAAAEQLRGHAGAGVVARADPRSRSSDPDEVHEIYRVPMRDLVDPTHRIIGTAPVGLASARASSSATTRTSSCGASPAASSPGSSSSSAGPRTSPTRRCVTSRTYMLQGEARHALPTSRPTRRFEERAVNLLDWLLLVLVVAYALSGYWQGFVTGAFATAGLLLGGLFGVWLAPIAPRRRQPVAAGLARGALHRDPAPRRWARRCCSTSAPGSATASPGSRSGPSTRSGGAALSAAAVLVVAWALGVAISGSGHRRHHPAGPRLRACSARSTGRCPTSANGVLDAFNDVVGTSFFPRYLEPFAPERIVEVGPGPTAAAQRPRRPRRAGQRAEDPRHQRLRPRRRGLRLRLRAGRLMTNAHVVAGVDAPGGASSATPPCRAEVVYYNPDLDVAVLAARHRPTPALVFDGRRQGPTQTRSRSWAIPRTAPTTCSPAGSGPSSSCGRPNIYGDGTVIREVFSLRGLVRPGNSGGPIVALGRRRGRAWSSRRRSPTRTPATRSPAEQVVAQRRPSAAQQRAQVSTGDCAS